MSQLYARIKTRVWRFQSRNTLLYLWGYGFNIGILTFIAWGIYEGRYELGLLVLFYGYFGRIWESVSELSSLTQDFITAKYSIARMRDVLDEPVTIDSDEGKVPVPPKWEEMRFENVSFSYEDSVALSDISFTVRRGEKVGIVGLSGAGKSTLFKLLLKEREEYTGTIAFDGIPLKEIARSSYFSHISAVLQDTEVFNLSLKDNIVIARGEEDARALENALEIAHVSDFLHKLPDGMDTLIGEKGIKLSGGERQRLGIARAVYKEPEILLLDEATSHLDLESEEKIQDSLHRFFETVTAIVIAHRLTTIREMDTILVMEGGRIVEQGSFEELSARKGRFWELWQKQKL
jgi:ATP-binding cassette subfamily B protein